MKKMTRVRVAGVRAGVRACGHACGRCELTPPPRLARRYTLAQSHYNLGDHYAALAACDAALALHPRFPEALCCRAACHNAVGNHKPAIADLDKALGIQPG
jgi:tetratricopeptide (TPR) repeat protein